MITQIKHLNNVSRTQLSEIKYHGFQTGEHFLQESHSLAFTSYLQKERGCWDSKLWHPCYIPKGKWNFLLCHFPCPSSPTLLTHKAHAYLKTENSFSCQQVKGKFSTCSGDFVSLKKIVNKQKSLTLKKQMQNTPEAQGYASLLHSD